MSVDWPEIKRKARDVLVTAFAAQDELEGEEADVDLQGYRVCYTKPGTRTNRDIVLGNLNGTADERSFGGEDLGRTDEMTMAVFVEVYGTNGDGEVPSEEAGDRVCQKAVALVESALFARQSLEPLNVRVTPGQKIPPNPYRTDKDGSYLLSAAAVYVTFIASI